MANTTPCIGKQKKSCLVYCRFYSIQTLVLKGCENIELWLVKYYYANAWPTKPVFFKSGGTSHPRIYECRERAEEERATNQRCILAVSDARKVTTALRASTVKRNHLSFTYKDSA